MLGGVERRHLDGGDGFEALRNGVADDAVHMALAHERAGMAVVGAQDEIARVEAGFRDRLDLLGHIIPGAAEPQHGAHALPHAGDGVFGLGALMVVFRAARDIAVKRQAQIRRGVMAADCFPGLLRRGNLAGHFRIIRRDAGKIHHFAKADNVRPAHRLLDIGDGNCRARRLQPRRGGHAAGHLHMDVDGHGHRLVMHQPHARQAEDIGDFVRVDEHRGRAVRDDGAGEFGDGDHAALDMHVAVAEARNEIAAIGIDDLRFRPDTMRGIGAAIGEAAFDDGEVRAGDDLAGMDIDPSAVPHHKVRLGAAHGDIDQFRRNFRPWLHGVRNFSHFPGFLLFQKQFMVIQPGSKPLSSRPLERMLMKNEVLIVIDMQNDFCPGGALAVAGGDEIVPLVNEQMRRFEHVILTQDWHPAGHSSFASQHPGKSPFETIEMPYGPQTLWPDHCIQGSSGAEFHPGLDVNRAELIIRKGFRKRGGFLFGVLRERSQNADRTWRLSERKGLGKSDILRPRHRLLRRLFGAGCAAAWA